MTSTIQPAKMQDFPSLQKEVAKQFAKLSGGRLYHTTTDPNQLWDTYLASFPPGSNPIYRTRTEHDCSCCQSFIKNIGGVVGIVDGAMTTLWNFPGKGHFGEVAKAMAALVSSQAITEPYLHTEGRVGTVASHELLADKSVVSRQLKSAEEEDFVAPARTGDKVLQLQLDILKHVIAVKQAENAAAWDLKERREKKERLLELIARKQDQVLEGKPLEELEAMVAAL